MEHSHRATPTAILVEEHTIILKVLASFELILKRIEEGGDPNPQLLEKTVEFFRGFADKCHHAKEEDLLFPAMEEAGMPREGGPVGMMLEEHDQGRAYIGGVLDGLGILAEDPQEARKKLLNNGWAFIQMLQAHIHKENEILFPMADRLIGSQKMHELTHAFEATQAELKENARRLVETAAEIERQVNG